MGEYSAEDTQRAVWLIDMIELCKIYCNCVECENRIICNEIYCKLIKTETLGARVYTIGEVK